MKHRQTSSTGHSGSCFHTIQDSCAVGHTRREPLNLGDRMPSGGIKYKPGVADRRGPILDFYTYGGQSHDHAIFNHSSDGSVENIDLASLGSWNDLVGWGDGLEACITLANC